MSKRSSLLHIEAKTRCPESPRNFSATHLHRPISNEFLTKFFWDVVMIALKGTSIHLIAIGKVDEFLNRLVADEVAPASPFEPPSRLIDKNHRRKVTRIQLPVRDPRSELVPILSAPRCQPRLLQMPPE